MGKSEVYLTSFDVSPVEYFDLMLDTVVQQEIHTSKDGLNMSVWRASDGPLLGVPNGTSRVVFSEPDLKVPKFLKNTQMAQAPAHDFDLNFDAAMDFKFDRCC